MRQSKTILSLLFFALFAVQSFAQSFENTYSWFTGSHSCWKVEPVTPFGYVMAGGKFFSSPNTIIYMTGFDEFGTHQWTRAHATEFASLQTFWKSFVKTTYGGPGFFVVSAGTQGGSNKAFAMLVNNYGMKYWDRVSPLPFGIQFGGVTNATNGGYVATGSTNTGNFAVVKFDPYGVIEWAYDLPENGFGWSVAQAVGGGYLLAGGSKVVKVSSNGNYEWTADINLPPSPSGAYSYSEFEEITPIPDGTGFVVTGSCFSNQHSGAYTARLTYTGGVSWAKVNDAVNTSGAGTPVCWINNAIIDNWGMEILTSWRRGPVSPGGTLNYQRSTFAGANIGGVTSMGNSIPVQEAFMTKAHQKYVVGGTRGGYSAAYSYVNASLPSAIGNNDDRTEPFVEESNPLVPVQTSIYNARPVFVYPPASRRFAAEMQVFPNPSSGEINIGGAIEPGALLRVISPMGNLILERRIQPGESQIQLQLPALATGLYIVEMIGEAGLTSKKVMVE